MFNQIAPFSVFPILAPEERVIRGVVKPNACLLFFLFIYLVWFGFSVKVENQKESGEKVTINPYDQIPLRRRLIDKKNSKVGIFDLGNHILIAGVILLVIFVSLNVE